MRYTMILAVIAVIALAARIASNVSDMVTPEEVVEKPIIVVVPKGNDQLANPPERTDVNPSIAPEPEATPAETPTPPVDPPATPEVDHSQCPHPVICESGDCQRDYAIVFSTEWCGPCKQLHRLTDRLRGDGFRIYYLDAEKAPTMAQRFGVAQVPTTVFFNGGRAVQKLVGVIDESTFRTFLKPRPVYQIVP